MCGRTCLTLDPDQILCACKYKINALNKQNAKAEAATFEEDKSPKNDVEIDDYKLPEWRAEFNCGRSYIPSYNITPTDITPVLVSANHFYENNNAEIKHQPRFIVPMMWGMIPFWHKGDYRKHGLITNNCRLEHLLESKLYSGPLRRGQRCVVLCEGFYEWQTTKSSKPSEREAYLIFMPQEDNVKIYDKTTWVSNNINLLKMAGLFDIWEDVNGDKIYSYSIITFESSKIMSWMHHRMPAILETEEQINNWLDYKNVPDRKALEVLKPATAIKWYRVSNLVNNSRNKSDHCNKPIEITRQVQKPKMNKIMSAWLNTHKTREENILTQIKKNRIDDDHDQLSSNNSNTDAKRKLNDEHESSISAKRQCPREFENKTKSSDHLAKGTTNK